ncbi:MAG: phosphate ABC transporter substrate-binding protein PstS [Comamonadaceae bacterium]|nr:phosphate ABC transporter substrate-binding protein PstS [Comamonadaceae bacterium]
MPPPPWPPWPWARPSLPTSPAPARPFRSRSTPSGPRPTRQPTGTGLNYQSIGSSGGIKQIRAKTVAFGASDAPVKGADLDKRRHGPVPGHHRRHRARVQPARVSSQGELRVTGPVLADMFLGKITKWNDPKLAALNPGKKLPDQTITVVHRADGSGTTFNWTDYLTAVSKDWADTRGQGCCRQVAGASSVGGKGNEGVAANVSRIKGVAGLRGVRLRQEEQHELHAAAAERATASTSCPDDKTFAAAAAGADWFSVPGMGVSMVNRQGRQELAGQHRLVHPDVQEPGRQGRNRPKCSSSSTGPSRTARRWPSDLDYVPLPDA